MQASSPARCKLSPDHRILEAFRKRLLSGISQSPLLKVRPTKTGRLLDCSRLNILKADLGSSILKAVIGNNGSITVDLPWRHVLSTEIAASMPEEPKLEEGQRIAKEQKEIEGMLTRIVRY